MYPMVIGQKGKAAVDHIGAQAIFRKYLNPLKRALLSDQNMEMNKEPTPTFVGCRTECMWAF